MPSLIDRLKAQTESYSRHIATARQQHVIEISTIASEGWEIQQELITALEIKVKTLETELEMYRTWEESREVQEFINRIKIVEEDRDAMVKVLVANGLAVPSVPSVR